MRVPVLVAALVAGALAGTPVAAHARASGPLDAAESTRLADGGTVIREHTLTRGDHRYVGGITYTILSVSPGEVAAIFDDVATYRKVLPRTKRARLVRREGEDMLVELAHGNAMYEAEYTIRVRRVGHEYRFWLVPSLPHEIDDAWGFFRFEPFSTPAGEPRVLCTYGVLVDVGPGIVRDFFEERVRAALLSVPQLLRRHVAEARR